jgi:hypothetical protein
MLDGSDEGEVNALSITRFFFIFVSFYFILFILEKENILHQGEKIKWLNYGGMMKELIIILVLDILVLLLGY